MKHTGYQSITALLLLLLLTPSFAQEPPTILNHFRATYDVRYHGMTVAKITRIFNSKKDGAFSLINRTEPLLPFFKVSIQERSLGQSTNHHVLSKNYLRRYNKENDQLTTSLSFNWQTHKAFYKQTGNPAHTDSKALSFDGDIYDPLSYHIAIKRDVAAGKKVLTYRIADKAKIKTYRFQVMGTSQLPTALGTLDTLVVEQIGKTSRSSKFWLAKDKGYLLVRYEQQRNQKPYFDIRIHSFEEGV